MTDSTPPDGRLEMVDALRGYALMGLFLVHMAGPGHVTLQTLPFSRTARRVLEASGGGRDESGVGGLLGSILE